MNRFPRGGRSGARTQTRSRYMARVSHAAIAACLIYGGSASAETAVFFNDDIAAGKQTFTDTIAAADANHNANNQGTTQTSHIYEFDILNTSGDTFLVIGANGAPSVVVKTTQGGVAAANNQLGNRGSDGFTNWGNSHNGTFASAEALGYTFQFFESDGATPFSMNALGTLVNDWGTCCTSNNPTPSGGTANASEVYLRFGASTPILLGGISSSISSTEHFIGAINDANFFDTVTVIASGNGEYFGVGGYLTFSTVALNSVPAGSSVVEGDGLENPAASIPDIDTGSSYYTAAQLGASQVNPNFVGGTLRFNMDTFVNSGFTVQSQGGTIDTEGNIVSITGGFSGSGTMQKTGEGLLVLSGTNTNAGGFSVLDGILRASSDDNLGGGPLRIGNAVFQVGADMDSSREMFVDHAGSRVDVQSHDVTWSGNISGDGALNLLGDGLLVLTGENDYEGGTYVEAGTLAGAAGALQGHIANNGAVEFRQAVNGIYSGAMSGQGALRKTGAGVLLLTGENSYSGGTDVSEGTLIGAAGALQGDISNAGTVEFRQSQDGVFAGDISGSGSVRKTGDGILLMTGENSYTGATEVAEGMLMGAASAIQGDVLNNASVMFVQAEDGAYSGNMSGEGALIKMGEGRLELSGENTFEGDVSVLEGILAASHDTNLGTGALTVGNAVFQAAGDIETSRELIMDHAASRMDVQSHDVLWNGVISGDGALNLLGDGRLELTGENTYSGGTYIEQGVLAGAAGSIQGDVWNDGTIEFLQDEDGEYAGTIVGDGELRKLGNGLLRLTGQSGIAGNTFLDEGSLSIDGFLGTELLTVANSASLFGNGGIDGSVMVLEGGMLKPGNSPGTLYVSGDVTLSQGSVFEAEIDGRVWSAEGGAGSYDRIVLTGEGATFTAGGSINPLLRDITGDASNAFTPVIGDVFTIVVADNVTGAFDAIVQPQSGLAPNTRFKVLYNAETIQLALVARSLATLAQENTLRSNAVAFGTALDQATAFGEQAGGELLPLFTEFDGMTQAQVAGALASLSGDMHAHILESTESILRSSDEMVMMAAAGGRMIGGVDRELKDGTRVWGRAEAGGASYDPDAAGFGFDEDVYGLTLGATILNTADTRAGIAGSYKTVELYNDTANGATNHMLSAYAYGSRTVTERLTVSGLLGYTEASPKVSRTTLLTSGTAFTKSDKPVSATHAQLEARYRLVNAGETSLYAIGGLRTAFMNVGAYRETGNIDHAELTLEAESRHTTQTNLGAEVARSIAGTDFSLFASWARDIGDDPAVERTAWLGDANWQVRSTNRGLDTYTYGFNARRDLSERVGLELSYKGRYNSPNYDAQQLLLGVSIAW